MQIPSVKPLLRPQLPPPRLWPQRSLLLLHRFSCSVSPPGPSAIGLFHLCPIFVHFLACADCATRPFTLSCQRRQIPHPLLLRRPWPVRRLHLLVGRHPESVPHVERSPRPLDSSHDKFVVPLPLGFSKMSKSLFVVSLKSFSHFSYLFLSLSIFKPLS